MTQRRTNKMLGHMATTVGFEKKITITISLRNAYLETAVRALRA